MNNLETWNKFNKPPLTALKTIGAGRLKGKSDINPQWRLQAMTEAFGPCGIGWKYTIDKLWTEAGTEGQVCAFAMVSVYIPATTTKDGWADPVPGIGGSMLITKEKAGLYTSDEAYKMAVTDALSVAFKALGVAAEIYLGNFDGSKYLNQPKEDAQDIAEITAKYYSECDQNTTVKSLVEWWKVNSEKVKKDIGTAEAAKLYKHLCENKKILEDIAKEGAKNGATD